MNVRTIVPGTPALMGGWLTDAGKYIGSAGRSAADMWNRALTPTIVPMPDEDNSMLLLAGVGAIGLLAVVMLKKKRGARR